MDLTTIEVTEPGGTASWTRADRIKEDGFRDTAVDQLGDQTADGRDQGSLKHGGKVYLWRFTVPAAAKRVETARTELARKVKSAKGDGKAVAYLETEDAAVLTRMAGWGSMRPKEIVALIIEPKPGAKRRDAAPLEA